MYLFTARTICVIIRLILCINIHHAHFVRVIFIIHTHFVRVNIVFIIFTEESNMLSERLKTCRKSIDKTQKELAEREPNLEILSKLADYFNVSTDYLLGRSDDPNRY